GVVDPGHRVRIGVNVRGGDVGVRADQVTEIGNEAARELAQLAGAELLRIASDAALGPAERNINDRAFPGQPGSESADFVERHIRVIANAALARPAHLAVQHAVAGEGPY